MARRWFAGLELLFIPALLTIWWDPFLAWNDALALLLLNVVPVVFEDFLLAEQMPMHQLLLGALGASGVPLDTNYTLLHGAWTLEQRSTDGQAESLRYFRQGGDLRLLGAPARSNPSAVPALKGPPDKP